MSARVKVALVAVLSIAGAAVCGGCPWGPP
jgi:hypothetical protein